MPVESAGGPNNTMVESSPQAEAPLRRWYDRLVGLLFAILCFEIGIFLFAFPWSRYWTTNSFSFLTPEWRQLWMDPYFRGAISGTGLVNLYVSLVEVFQLQNPHRESDPEQAEPTA